MHSTAASLVMQKLYSSFQTQMHWHCLYMAVILKIVNKLFIFSCLGTVELIQIFLILHYWYHMKTMTAKQMSLALSSLLLRANNTISPLAKFKEELFNHFCLALVCLSKLWFPWILLFRPLLLLLPLAILMSERYQGWPAFNTTGVYSFPVMSCESIKGWVLGLNSKIWVLQTNSALGRTDGEWQIFKNEENKQLKKETL